MSIQDAIRDVVLFVKEDGMTSQQAYDAAAEDYDLNPVLVARKFEEQYGMDAQAYVDQKDEPVYVQPESQTLAAKIERARERGKEWARKELVNGAAHFDGRAFPHEGAMYVLIGFIGRNRQVWAVQVSNNHVVHWAGKHAMYFNNVAIKYANKSKADPLPLKQMSTGNPEAVADMIADQSN